MTNSVSAETAIEVVGIAPGHPSIKLDTVGDLFGLGTVFYSPLVAANVLSLADMEARHEVTYRKGSFEVKLASGNVVAFNRGASQQHVVGYSKHYVARFPRRSAWNIKRSDSIKLNIFFLVLTPLPQRMIILRRRSQVELL